MKRKFSAGLLISILSTMSACGGNAPAAHSGDGVRSTRRGGLSSGDFEGPPALTALPEADVPESRWSERLRFGYELAEEALTLQMPTPPVGASSETLTAWTQADLEPWIGRKSHAIEAATTELRKAAADGGRERIMAAAIIALMYENFAHSLRTIPTPSDFERDEEAARIYREVIEHYARPYAGRADIAYRNCERDVRGAPGQMRHWGKFCEERKARLGYQDEDPSVEAGQTRVEVVTEEAD